MQLWREKNPEYTKKWNDANKQKARNGQLKIKYNLTPEKYQAIHDAQGGVCAICLEPESFLTPKGNIRPLAVDHDHNTGKVRGLLCDRCNLGLGVGYLG